MRSGAGNWSIMGARSTFSGTFRSNSRPFHSSSRPYSISSSTLLRKSSSQDPPLICQQRLTLCGQVLALLLIEVLFIPLRGDQFVIGPDLEIQHEAVGFGLLCVFCHACLSPSFLLSV